MRKRRKSSCEKVMGVEETSTLMRPSAHPVIEPRPVAEVDSHLLFCPPLKRFLFSHADLSCSPNYLIQKTHSHLPCSSTYVKGFFSLKTLFLFCRHCHSYIKLKEHGHRLSPLLMFKEE